MALFVYLWNALWRHPLASPHYPLATLHVFLPFALYVHLQQPILLSDYLHLLGYFDVISYRVVGIPIQIIYDLYARYHFISVSELEVTYLLLEL